MVSDQAAQSHAANDEAANWATHDPAGGLSVQPNPAQTGSTLTIQGASGTTVTVVMNGAGKAEVKIGKDGKASFEIPNGFDGTILVTDGAYPRPSTVRVTVLSGSK